MIMLAGLAALMGILARAEAPMHFPQDGAGVPVVAAAKILTPELRVVVRFKVDRAAVAVAALLRPT